jgi:hypothetical protein
MRPSTPEDTPADEWLYNLATSTIAATGVLTRGGAAFIAYRRQRSVGSQNRLDWTRSEVERFTRGGMPTRRHRRWRSAQAASCPNQSVVNAPRTHQPQFRGVYDQLARWRRPTL